VVNQMLHVQLSIHPQSFLCVPTNSPTRDGWVQANAGHKLDVHDSNEGSEDIDPEEGSFMMSIYRIATMHIQGLPDPVANRQ
jgi:hypothetical protein